LNALASLFQWSLHRAFYKWSAALLLALSVAFVTYRVLTNPASWPRRSWTLYVTGLERKLRDMFVQTSGSVIAVAQLVCVALTLAIRLLTGFPYLEFLVVVIAVGPTLYIERMRLHRIRVIEKQVEPFILSLASALKTTPSIGNALASVHTLLTPPLQDEIGLVLKEMRLGSTLEQSLLNFGGRIPIVQLDATLASILIGRQVGGNLPEILDSTAATLREMERLAGVMRTKTASGKIQVFVLAGIPPVVILMLDLISPRYFDPLTSSAFGVVLVTAASFLWFGSVIMARKIVQVEL
jgi:tight adherence protein B